MSEINNKFSDDPLEKIAENESENEELDEEKEENANKIISDLLEKNVLLEKTNKDLKNKIESLTKKQTLNSSILTKIATVGLRKFTLKSDLQKDSVKLAEITKEKDELQQINEKMLDMLTENELEIDDLNKKLEDCKLEAKIQNEKNLEQIKALEERIESLENTEKDNEFDEVFNEYENNKVKLQKQISGFTKLEEELNYQLDEKDKKIKKLNDEIQNLQFENLRLLNQSDLQDKINQAGFLDMQKLTEELNKNKNEIETLTNELNKKKREMKSLEENKDKEIEKYVEEIEKLKKSNETLNNDLKRLDKLNTQLNNSNKEVSISMTYMEKTLNEEKEKNYKIQAKLDKNIKELKDINDYYKTLKTNNESLLSDYQKKIDELTNDKYSLISQNKELLEKLKEKKEEEDQGVNLADMMGDEEEKDNKEETENSNTKDKENLAFYKNENQLLTEEIKGLKEQLNSQAHDLVELNTLEKNIEKLKIENDDLNKNNKELKEQLEQEKLKEKITKPIKTENTGIRGLSALRRVQTLSRKQTTKAANIEKDKLLLQKNYDRLKQLREDDKKNYEDQIEKLKLDIVTIKVKFLNKQYEDEKLLLKYKNTIKSIANQCKIKGIKLSLNLISV
jgi:hypothetical protein